MGETRRSGDYSDEPAFDAEHQAGAAGPMPLAVCIPLIAALSLAGWLVIALLFHVLA